MLRPEISRSLLVGTFAALVIALAPAAASAGDAALVRKSVTVRVADLDLRRPADARKLQQRIRRAAEIACSDGFAPGSPGALEPDRECVAAAISNALARLQPVDVAYERGSQAQLSAYYQQNWKPSRAASKAG
jgi:UrcA family protein